MGKSSVLSSLCVLNFPSQWDEERTCVLQYRQHRELQLICHIVKLIIDEREGFSGTCLFSDFKGNQKQKPDLRSSYQQRHKYLKKKHRCFKPTPACSSSFELFTVILKRLPDLSFDFESCKLLCKMPNQLCATLSMLAII